MKSRSEVVEFLHNRDECSREKDSYIHFGLQDLREILDFIYESEPLSNNECLMRLEKSNPTTVDFQPSTDEEIKRAQQKSLNVKKEHDLAIEIAMSINPGC